MRKEMTFKKHEKELIKRLVTDCWILGFSEDESLNYIAQRVGRPVSSAHYYRVKKFIISNEANNEWLNHHARIGLITNLRKRLDIVENQIEDTLQMLQAEKQRASAFASFDTALTSKRNDSLILSLKKELREEVMLAHELDAASPILGKFKALIRGNDIDKSMKREGERINIDAKALEELWKLCDAD